MVTPVGDEEGPDWGIRLTARIPRLSWALKGLFGGREDAWRLLERRFTAWVSPYPQLQLIGTPERSTSARSWWWLQMQLLQPANGPYVAELAEGLVRPEDGD